MRCGGFAHDSLTALMATIHLAAEKNDVAALKRHIAGVRHTHGTVCRAIVSQGLLLPLLPFPRLQSPPATRPPLRAPT